MPDALLSWRPSHNLRLACIIHKRQAWWAGTGTGSFEEINDRQVALLALCVVDRA